VAQALAALSVGTTGVLLVVLAARRLHGSGSGCGWLLGAIAAGAFTDPVRLARLPPARGCEVEFFDGSEDEASSGPWNSTSRTDCR
jgi:hypothetical protein